MSENTQTENDDIFDGEIHNQTTEAVLGAVTAAEHEVLLRDMFGVSLPATIQSREIANAVAHRVTLAIDQTRSNIDRGELADLLDRNIQQRLNNAQKTSADNAQLTAVTDTRRNREIRAIAEGIRESIPSGVMTDFVRYGLPAVVSKEAPNVVPEHHFQVECAIDSKKRTVLIDTRHSFWRENTFEKEDNLKDALKKLDTLASAGIRVIGPPPLPENYKLTEGDINEILKAQSEVLDLGQRYENISGDVTVGGQQVRVSINLAGLLRYRDASGMLVAEYQRNSSGNTISTLLQSDENIWNFITTDPSIDGSSFPALCTRLQFMIYNHLGVPVGSSIALKPMNIFDVQSQVAEQHKLHTALREGSDNQMAAAFASSILMRYKDIRSSIAGGNQKEAQDNLDKETARYSAIKSIDAASAVGYHPACAWDEAEARISDYGTALSECKVGGTPKMGSETYATISAAAEITNARTWVETQYKEAKKAELDSKRLSEYCIDIARQVHSITGKTSGLILLDTYVDVSSTPPTLKSGVKSLFTKNLDVNGIVQEIKNDPDMRLKEAAEHKTSVARYKAELEKIQNNEFPKGAQAQHKVIKEYLQKYHGLTDAEANSGTNVIRTHNLLDTEMSAVVNDISRELHGEFTEEEATKDETSRFRWAAKRDRKRIVEVAKAAHIRVSDDDTPMWSSGRYENIMSAYFALRQMSEGTGVPWMVRLSGSSLARKQMQEITRTIFQNHAKAMLQEFGASLSISDDTRKEILKDPTKPEHQEVLLHVLDSDVPVHQQEGVGRILQTVNAKLFRKRRMVGNVTKIAAGSMLYGDKNPLSAKNLLYGNKRFSVRGVARGIKNTATSITGNLWTNKATLAKIGLCTVIGGPLGLLGSTAIFGNELKHWKSSSGSSSYSMAA